MTIFKRTFHPVGQGAFFTEQFYDDDIENLSYNVVYDCGSKSIDIKKQMEHSINNVLYDRKQIDALFLSHFDDDHVNYVNYLKEKGYLQNTRIFIPMLAEEEWLGIEPFATNYHLILSLHEQEIGGTKVIRVNFDDGDGGNRIPENRYEARMIEDIEEDTIPSGTVLSPGFKRPDIIWCYTPFNVNFKMLISDFKDKLSNVGLDYNKLTDKDYVLEHQKKLKEIYKKLGPKPSGGTAINLNSLLVMSYPKDPCDCIRIRHDFFMRRCYHWRCYYGDCYGGSCLYTGDTSAKEPMVWNRIERMINQCLGNRVRLGLLQVPHHGSRHSYDQKLVESDRYCVGFTNFDPYFRQHIFDDNLVMKFALNNKPLVLVTQEYGSKYEEYWEI